MGAYVTAVFSILGSFFPQFCITADASLVVRAIRGPNERRMTMQDSAIKTIGLIGAGHIGRQIARLAVENDYNVSREDSNGVSRLSGQSS
jgi:hypothetical protein